MPLLPALRAGIGAMLALFVLALLSRQSLPLLMAPFGASCAILFALPASPLAHPRNVIGGHVITAATGLLVLHLLGSSPLTLALAGGLGIALMLLTDTLHPPAGANPLLILLAPTLLPWSFLLTPVLTGAVLLVLAARSYHHGMATFARLRDAT
ncbi:HPP family protein [Chitinilyticum piscinae]|uniref:HPP family protein n=1 Tax=Chitinilyticum piscinae TaxID=2866724 RepID=A0A8J7K0J5_9NEIS|nr:HPP family protein [Chitinilyticum piscinae]MBE9608141.1 HPP family protein [Chitinilyticum piscinae]